MYISGMESQYERYAAYATLSIMSDEEKAYSKLKEKLMNERFKPDNPFESYEYVRDSPQREWDKYDI